MMSPCSDLHSLARVWINAILLLVCIHRKLLLHCSQVKLCETDGIGTSPHSLKFNPPLAPCVHKHRLAAGAPQSHCNSHASARREGGAGGYEQRPFCAGSAAGTALGWRGLGFPLPTQFPRECAERRRGRLVCMARVVPPLLCVSSPP